MRRRRHGSVLVVTIFLSCAFVILLRLLADLSLASYVADRSAGVADAVGLSSLRMRASALRAIADRWNQFGPVFGAVLGDQKVRLAANRWSDVQKSALDLKRALPGYQGRITAILKVVTEANALTAGTVDIGLSDASKLGVSAEPLIVQDEIGNEMKIDGGWLRRSWSLDASEDPVGTSSYLASLSARRSDGGVWRVERGGAARLHWDASNAQRRDAIAGGYPSNWSEATASARVKPYAAAFYRATLASER